MYSLHTLEKACPIPLEPTIYLMSDTLYHVSLEMPRCLPSGWVDSTRKFPILLLSERVTCTYNIGALFNCRSKGKELSKKAKAGVELIFCSSVMHHIVDGSIHFSPGLYRLLI